MSLTFGSEKVSDIAKRMDLPGDVVEKAEWLAKRADFEHPINRSPDVIAAGAVYIACRLHNERRYRGEVTDVSGVSKQSITECYQEICYHEDILLGKETKLGRKQRQEGVTYGDFTGGPE
mgnify:CR=1 FL=1